MQDPVALGLGDGPLLGNSSGPSAGKAASAPAPPASPACAGLTKVGWSSDGRLLAVGDLEGQIAVCKVDPKVAEPPRDLGAHELEKIAARLAGARA